MPVPSDAIAEPGLGPLAGGFTRVGVVPTFRGRIVQLNVEQYLDPEGRPFEREIVRHPGAVVVVPVTAEGSVVMIRQFRATAGDVLLEMPAGLLDIAGEPLMEAAARELREEVGLVAEHWEVLATAYHSPGFSDEQVTIFLATGLHAVDHERHGPEEQFMEVVELPLADARAAVVDGRVTNAAAVIGLLLASTHPGLGVSAGR